MKSFFVILLLALAASPTASFVLNSDRANHPTKILNTRSEESWRRTVRMFESEKETEEKVEVGSKTYYEGFLSSPIQDETVQERGSGLEQALKLAGSFAVGLVVLFLGFMASNGLL